MADSDQFGKYVFSDHLANIEWISQLPEGCLQDEVDLAAHSVLVDELEEGYSIYVGPLDSAQGGSAIWVHLDEDALLVDYELETLDSDEYDF